MVGGTHVLLYLSHVLSRAGVIDRGANTPSCCAARGFAGSPKRPRVVGFRALAGVCDGKFCAAASHRSDIVRGTNACRLGHCLWASQLR